MEDVKQRELDEVISSLIINITLNLFTETQRRKSQISGGIQSQNQTNGKRN